jgi:hypothetical protein
LEKVNVLQIGKLDAANRQLDFAIALFFSGGDPVCVHTLAGAASILLSDLIESRDPGESWDRMAQADNNLSPSEYFKIARNSQNFVKHAKHDSNAVLRFNERDTEDMIMITVLNSGHLQKLSVHQEVFGLWYLARNADTLGPDYPFVTDALNLFPRIDALPPHDQRAVGLGVLRAELRAGARQT